MDPFEDGPEQEWEPIGPAPIRPRKPTRKKESDPVPQLSDEDHTVRAAWIRAVREFRLRASGEVINYNSNVQWDGGVQRMVGGKTRICKPVWPKVVAEARAAGVDPTVLVKVLFASWTSDTIPTPHDLVRPHVVAKARGARQGRRLAIANALRTEEGVYRAAVWAATISTPDPARAVAFALNDLGRDMSPLFRYAAAELRGLRDVSERWYQSAAAQYRTDPAAYDEFWGHLIPVDIKQSATPEALGA